MIKLYGPPLSAPVNRVRFLLNELGEEYELVQINMMAGEHKGGEHLKRHPFGKVPAIEDGDFKLFESNTILRYIAEKNNSDLYPQDKKQRIMVDQWLDFVIAHVQPAIVRIAFNKLFAKLVPGAEYDEKSVAFGEELMARFLPVINEQLGSNKFIAGDKMSIADMSLLSILDPAESVELDLNQYPNLSKWRNELMQKDWYTKCHKSYQEVLQSVMASA